MTSTRLDRRRDWKQFWSLYFCLKEIQSSINPSRDPSRSIIFCHRSVQQILNHKNCTGVFSSETDDDIWLDGLPCWLIKALTRNRCSLEAQNALIKNAVAWALGVATWVLLRPFLPTNQIPLYRNISVVPSALSMCASEQWRVGRTHRDIHAYDRPIGRDCPDRQAV